MIAAKLFVVLATVCVCYALPHETGHSYQSVVHHGHGGHGGLGGGLGGGLVGGLGGGLGGAWGGAGVGDAGYGGHHDYHDTHPNYKFNYGVKDAHTGDHKEQWEQRDGDHVKGGYSLQESDGTTRVVEYTSDKHNGFNAIVKKIGHAHHPQVYAKHHDGGYGAGISGGLGHGHGHATSFNNVNQISLGHGHGGW